MSAVPLIGFSMKALTRFCEANKTQIADTYSTKMVCDNIVKPLTEADQCSMVQWWEKYESHIPNLVGPATVFISHAWSYTFNSVVDVVTQFCKDEHSSEAMYFWFDCFVNNQHIDQTVPYEKLKQLFGESLKNVGKALVILMPWRKPDYITRCWCLFELYTILELNIKYEIRMSEVDRIEFLKCLADGSFTGDQSTKFDLFKQLENIKSQLAVAWSKADKENITRLIESRDGGFRRLDAKVYHALRQWFFHVAKAHLTTFTEINENYCAMANNVASLSIELGEYNEGEHILKQALEDSETILDKDKQDHALLLSNYAICLDLQGKHRDAEKIHRGLVASNEQLAEEKGEKLKSLVNYGRCLNSQAKFNEAEVMLKDSLAQCQRLFGRGDPLTQLSRTSLADCYYEQRKFEDAEPLWRECLAETDAKLGSSHPETLRANGNLTSCLVKLGKYKEAEQICEKCLEDLEKVLGNEHPLTLSMLNNLAYCYEKQNELSQAEALYRRCLNGTTEKIGCDHPDTLSALDNLAVCLIRKKGPFSRLSEAEAILHDCYVKRGVVLGADHPDTLTTLSNLALCLSSQGKLSEAEPMYGKCYAMTKAKFGNDHPETLTSLGNLMLNLNLQGKSGDFDRGNEKKKTIGQETVAKGKNVTDKKSKATSLPTGPGAVGNATKTSSSSSLKKGNRF